MSGDHGGRRSSSLRPGFWFSLFFLFSLLEQRVHCLDREQQLPFSGSQFASDLNLSQAMESPFSSSSRTISLSDLPGGTQVYFLNLFCTYFLYLFVFLANISIWTKVAGIFPVESTSFRSELLSITFKRAYSRFSNARRLDFVCIWHWCESHIPAV